MASHRRRSNSLVTRYSRFKMSTKPCDLALGVKNFCKAFPFHVVIDKNLQIVQLGVALNRVLRHLFRNKKIFFKDVLAIQRPVMELSFNGILNHVNSVFVVYTQPNVLSIRSACMHLKGQMVYIPESGCILFLCSPRVSNIEDLKCKGLYLSDIPLHDATRDLVLITQARRAERELVERMEETSNNLQKLQTKLQQDKQRTDFLLHSILPSKVAEKLRLNMPVEAERYSLVTILFSDIVQFTNMCGDEKVVPMDIVRMLNKLYTQFDMLSSLNGVYKVETIGDAYMVVGGLPEYTVRHADQVVSMAFGMVEVAKTVLSPVDGKPIKIRIGIHSGECVAGVVGQRMPRYCLFGHTVAMASKMEGLSRPGKINISNTSVRYLTDPSNYMLEENKVNLPCTCYFINTTPTSPRPVTMDLSLPLPKGMFRTPNPSPVTSLNSSPVGTPGRTTPKTVNSPEFKPRVGMPSIQITSADDELLTMYESQIGQMDDALNKVSDMKGDIDQSLIKHRHVCEALAKIQIPECVVVDTDSASRSNLLPKTCTKSNVAEDLNTSNCTTTRDSLDTLDDDVDDDDDDKTRISAALFLEKHTGNGTHAPQADIVSDDRTKCVQGGKSCLNNKVIVEKNMQGNLSHFKNDQISATQCGTIEKSQVNVKSQSMVQSAKINSLLKTVTDKKTDKLTDKENPQSQADVSKSIKRYGEKTKKGVPQGATLPFTVNIDSSYPVRGIIASHSTGSIQRDRGNVQGIPKLNPLLFGSQYSLSVRDSGDKSKQAQLQTVLTKDSRDTYSRCSDICGNIVHNETSTDKSNMCQTKENCSFSALTKDDVNLNKIIPECEKVTSTQRKQNALSLKCVNNNNGDSDKLLPLPSSEQMSKSTTKPLKSRHKSSRHSLQETFVFGEDLSRFEKYSVNGYLRSGNSSLKNVLANDRLILYFKGPRPRSVSPRRVASCGSSPKSKTPEPQKRILFPLNPDLSSETKCALHESKC